MGSTARCDHSASAIGGELYVVGGMDNDRNSFNSGECYDPVKGSWRVLAPMSVARRLHSASVIAGKLYIVGGIGIRNTLNSVECFDPVAGQLARPRTDVDR